MNPFNFVFSAADSKSIRQVSSVVPERSAKVIVI
jgi:hypothetical protein